MNQIQFPPPAATGALPPSALRSNGSASSRKAIASRERMAAAAALSQSLSTLGADHAEQIRAAASAASRQSAATLARHLVAKTRREGTRP